MRMVPNCHLTSGLQLAGRPVKKDVEVTVSHEEVLHMGKAKAEVMRQLVEIICDLVANTA